MKKLKCAMVLVLIMGLLTGCSNIGDINKDGKITLLDLLIVKKYTLGTKQIHVDDIHLMDFNKDGYVNKKDVSAIQNYLLEGGE